MSTVTVGSGPAEEEKKFIPEKESGAEFGPMPQVDLLTERIAEFADIKNQSRLAELTAQADFNAQMFAQEKSVQDNNKKLWQSGAKGKMQIASKMMGSLSSLMNSENRKMFEVGKAAATGQAVIDTYKAATGAYSAMSSIPYVGPALGAAAAAAAVASGMAQVQKIQSTQFGGGGGASAAGVTGAGVAGTPQPQEVIQTTQFDVSLQGESFSGEQIRGLVGQINDATDDNIKLNAVSA